jgi:hypothetical protein
MVCAKYSVLMIHQTTHFVGQAVKQDVNFARHVMQECLECRWGLTFDYETTSVSSSRGGAIVVMLGVTHLCAETLHLALDILQQTTITLRQVLVLFEISIIMEPENLHSKICKAENSLCNKSYELKIHLKVIVLFEIIFEVRFYHKNLIFVLYLKCKDIFDRKIAIK